MEKYFANYNQSLALKELGFDEPCFAGYRDSDWIGTDGPNSRYFHAQLFSNHQFDDDQKEYCSAPLKSQVFEFFRDKYKYYFWIEPCSEHKLFHFNITCSPSSFTYWTIDEVKPNNGGFKSYEEAESAAIDKLIELVKNK